MAGEWVSIALPEGAMPVSNRHGTFLLATAEQKAQYKLWKVYQRHDGQFWLYFGSGIKRKADDILPGYQVARVL